MKATGKKFLFFALLWLCACAHQAVPLAPLRPAAPPKVQKAASPPESTLGEKFRQALRLGSLSPLDLRLAGTAQNPVLVGEVGSADQKAALENVVRAFKGVRSVTSRLEVKPMPAPATEIVYRSSRLQWVLVVALSLLALLLAFTLVRSRRRERRLWLQVRAISERSGTEKPFPRELPKVS